MGPAVLGKRLVRADLPWPPPPPPGAHWSHEEGALGPLPGPVPPGWAPEASFGVDTGLAVPPRVRGGARRGAAGGGLPGGGGWGHGPGEGTERPGTCWSGERMCLREEGGGLCRGAAGHVGEVADGVLLEAEPLPTPLHCWEPLVPLCWGRAGTLLSGRAWWDGFCLLQATCRVRAVLRGSRWGLRGAEGWAP